MGLTKGVRCVVREDSFSSPAYSIGPVAKKLVGNVFELR